MHLYYIISLLRYQKKVVNETQSLNIECFNEKSKQSLNLGNKIGKRKKKSKPHVAEMSIKPKLLNLTEKKHAMHRKFISVDIGQYHKQPGLADYID